jgi:hypothetical protein
MNRKCEEIKMRPLTITVIGLASALMSIVPASPVAAQAGIPKCTSCFNAEPTFGPDPASPNGAKKILLNDIYFVDAHSLVWMAPKGESTDGASIPPLFQPIVGGAWTVAFLNAAVVHDHYCLKDHYVRKWQAAARMFYEGLIVKKVDPVKAKAMYYAVYTFGPHWERKEMVPGTPCGPRCTMQFEPALDIMGMKSDTFELKRRRMATASEPADYSLAHKTELDQIQKKIQAAESSGTPLSLDDLDNEALKANAGNYFIMSASLIQ